MLQNISQYLALVMLFVGAFYALIAISGLVNLYLRHIDHLSIDTEDKQTIQSSLLKGIALVLGAVAFKYLPFLYVLVILLIFVLLFQMTTISRLMKKFKAS